MRQAHQAVTQAATELGLAESALQHPSELGLRHTFMALEMGKRVETVRLASARDEAQSAYAHALMNHDMPEPQNLTLLSGVLAMSLAELHAATFCVTVPCLCLIQICLCLYKHEQYNTLSETARIALMLLACGTSVRFLPLTPPPSSGWTLRAVGGSAHTSNRLLWGCSAQGLQLQM